MKTKHLSFTYRGNSTPTLEDISTSFAANSITALLGPNGAGKTTLLRILAGLISDHSGEIELNGQLANLENLHSEVFYVGSAKEYAEYAIQDILAYLSLRKTWNEELYQQLIDHFEINLKPRRTFKKLSTGEGNLLLAIFALASEARFTLLDEIQANLDVPTRYRLYEKIIDLNARGLDEAKTPRSFVISSHMVGELETLCNEVRIINKGKLIFADSTEALKAKYRSIQGSTADIEKFQKEYPHLKISFSRTLGSFKEIIVEIPPTGFPLLTDFSTLASQPLSFQDAFVAQLAKE
ncbi:ABC transporter ATP-binding protein [Gleimia sp. 6138-11-ORH1]|uniref:ATP-binding cassette domain-containing protein n=1 Tax=Gleimia sp. 6138-11-ORH1 TaxID=2973937 RepID=UPI002166ECE7|nr:ABC transporter ATP-binding protein [Gleimia sp. 6138-11-ORH1]MCS4484169.1 ABC transporter ATP-binding protein [Gleimia sp. 6138-11-ORH1]